MSETVVRPVAPAGASASVIIGTFGLILALIVFLFVFDTFLARIDRAEASSRAASEYREGRQLVAAGQVSEAADRFRTAASMDRSNPSYSLALAQAMLAQGKASDAEELLQALLQRAPNDGTVNMVMARALVQEGRTEDAIAYYHRALYGRWVPGEDGSSMQARFELIDLLARIGARKELLAELLPIQDQSLDDLDLRDRIGHLFLVAGSPARAADVFHDVLRHRPRDAVAYAGLGEAALALGNYGSAETYLAKASRLAPHDSIVTTRLDLAHALQALDPTRRGLRLAERYARSRRLVQLTIGVLGRCTIDTAAHTAVRYADSVISTQNGAAGAVNMDDAVEQDLSLAQRLWGMRPAACPVGSTTEEKALLLLQDRLAQ